MARNNPSTPSNNPAYKLSREIIKSDLHEGYRAADWFGMMVDDCLAGFGKKLETPWGEKEHTHLFELGKVYAEAVIENPFTDMLGGVYQELVSHFGKKGMGQYFTPDAVAKMMATINCKPEDFEQKNVVRLYEPAVGSGVLVLAFIDAVRKVNPEHLNKLSVTIVDLDKLCVKMSVLQVMSNNLIHTQNLGELRAFHGNSLGDPKDLAPFYHVSTPTFDALDQLEIRSKGEDSVAIVVDERDVEAERQRHIKPRKNGSRPIQEGQIDMFDIE